MAQSYLNKVLDEVFREATAAEIRENSERNSIHHALITIDFIEHGYGAGMDSFGVEYTIDDLNDLSEAFIKGVRRGAKSSRSRRSGRRQRCR